MPSAWNICGLGAKNCENKSLASMFTEHVRNAVFANEGAYLTAGAVQKLYCEIWNDGRDKVKLEVYRRLAVIDEQPIGFVAIAKSVQEFPTLSLQNGLAPSIGLDCLEFFARLSIGEVEVIKLVIDGLLNKTIAKQLGIALRTVEARRSKAMSKLGGSTVPDLVKLWCSFQDRY